MRNSLLAFFLLFSFNLYGAGEKIDIPKYDWSWKGFFGTYDRASAQRGLKVYREVCAGCHSMNYLSYRNLADLGFSQDHIKAIAAEHLILDGPDDEGEMFERDGIPSDQFVNPYLNEKAARAANNGAYPPDLSLIVKARPKTITNKDNKVVFCLSNKEKKPRSGLIDESIENATNPVKPIKKTIGTIIKKDIIKLFFKVL